ncbi:MAG: A/G-specific adenine glycosylase [Ignavibacteriales bacterium]|nr:A/G-specific adenine glycosylase [Ignavibacteriales bacterium]
MKPLSKIQKIILRWYSTEARSLPWRKTRNPYRILVSEVMLQQTQVHRVLQKYPKFIKRFPSFGSLARARTSSVIRAWRGMGYNNRAVRLQRLAKEIANKHQGKLPRTIPQLESLPGIGPYTARAVSCFAFGQCVPVVDTNVHRVLHRIFPKETRDEEIWNVAERALPVRNAYSWNQALMELGATVCVARNPCCEKCPVKRTCPSAFTKKIARRHNGVREPGRNGVPNRIFRGRIVETLRDSHQSVKASLLGRRLMPGFREKDRPWLIQLLKGLERDGLVRIHNHRKETEVSLAQ